MTPGAQTTDAYMREGGRQGITPVSGSWKYVCGHYLFKSERDAYPLISISLVAYVIENFIQLPQIIYEWGLGDI